MSISFRIAQRKLGTYKKVSTGKKLRAEKMRRNVCNAMV